MYLYFFVTVIMISPNHIIAAPKDIHFTVLQHITGDRRLHSRFPKICGSHKNIYLIAFYSEISHFFSTNLRLTQNVYQILKLHLDNIGFSSYSKIFASVYSHTKFIF